MTDDAEARLLDNYRTGQPELDGAVEDLVRLAGAGADGDLVAEMVVSALRLGYEEVGRGDLKLVNSALKELRYAIGVFAPYRGIRKATIFGSARIQPHEAAYAAARDFGAAIVERDWMVMTGAGPGIMAAGLEGAGAEASFGINIQLPFEAQANAFIVEDPKLINFRYFFTRKVTFMKETHGYVLLPGGFGTMDEAFELLTLMQTGKSFLAPVVLLDPPGSTYWPTWHEFVERELAGKNLIAPNDLDLVRVTNDVSEAVDELCRFYWSYHSMRYVGGRLVLRLNRDVDDAELAALNAEFGDLLDRGRIERTEASTSEIAADDQVDAPRLTMHFDRRSLSRLRLLIDRINDATPEALRHR